MMFASTLQLPEPLRGLEPGTFAHYTITTRLPNIARLVLAENRLSPAAAAKLERLIDELPYGPIRPLDSGAAPDARAWDAYVQPYLGQNWLEAPALFAETYFYRRILEATGYFHAGPGLGIDPYAQQKRTGLETTRAAIRMLSDHAESLARGTVDPNVALERMLSVALWGNRADLSLVPAADGEATNAQMVSHLSTGRIDPQTANVLINDTPRVAAFVAERNARAARVDVILDNAGFELIGDLLLADFLLRSKRAASVQFHLKAHPTFVSDAVIEDVRETLAFLASDAHSSVRRLADRVREHVQRGRLRLRSDDFWTAPLRMSDMPRPLRWQLSGSSLIVVKGDMNYRRLLGDYRWPFTTPFEDVVSYAPAPLVALRTIKAELAAGLAPGQQQALDHADPDWMTTGRWGVIQFAPGAVPLPVERRHSMVFDKVHEYVTA